MNWRYIALWIVGIALLGFGVFAMVASEHKEWVSKLTWDPSMLSLGLALAGLGFLFMERAKTRQ